MIFKRQIIRQISANILPTVLIVGTLMLLIIITLFSLFDSETLFFHIKHNAKQKQEWLRSAIVLWERDTLKNTVTIFPDDTASRVTILTSQWGLYELVKVYSPGGKEKMAVLAGNAYASNYEDAALYVCNTGVSFALSGKSDIKGRVYTSANGIQYNRVLSDYYRGRTIPQSQLKESGPDFPKLNRGICDSIKLLIENAATAAQTARFDQKHVGFFEPTEFYYAEDLRGASMSGNMIIYSENHIDIDSTSLLNDIIIIAPKVMIADGFRGSLQVIARDSMTIGHRVHLTYPSGIIMPDAPQSGYMTVAPESTIDGYAIFKINVPIDPNKRTANYKQEEGARVRGLIWIDGISQIHGTVMGGLYLNYAAYFTAYGYYTDLMYNASVYESKAVAFPLWMESRYKKKSIKWLE